MASVEPNSLLDPFSSLNPRTLRFRPPLDLLLNILNKPKGPPFLMEMREDPPHVR